MSFIYKPKSRKQLENNFRYRNRKGVNGFKDLKDFLDWYSEQELLCSYCGLTELEMQELSMSGLLSSKRFPKNGIVGQGTSRAVWLEVDRLNPNYLYSRDNCVLCCYFCNNDKSDVFHGYDYTNFFQNRVEYLRKVIKK